MQHKVVQVIPAMLVTFPMIISQI